MRAKHTKPPPAPTQLQSDALAHTAPSPTVLSPRRGGALGRPWRTRPPPGFVQTEDRQEAAQHQGTEPGHEQDGGRPQTVAPHRSGTYTELKVTEHQIPSLDLISGYSAACGRHSSPE